MVLALRRTWKTFCGQQKEGEAVKHRWILGLISREPLRDLTQLPWL